jgi:ssDNA-binding replication factor A large subunit
MEFFIRQYATDPILKLALIDDGKNDKSIFNDILESSNITFQMNDVKTDIPVILGGTCYLTTRTKKFNNNTDEYYIVYRFTEEQTAIKGRFEGIVTIEFLDVNLNPTSKLILPIREKLFINII